MSTAPRGPTVHCGSIIRCESQALGEQIGLAGTPYQLVYASEQVIGGRYQYHLDIPVTVGVVPPPSLGRVEVDVTIAGVLFTEVYSPAPDLVFTVAWDGRDAYGRLVQGEQPYSVEIRYVYPGVYDAGMAVPLSFALASGVDFGFVATPRMREGLEFVHFQRAADTNDDGVLDLSDAVSILNFLFLGGPPPKVPSGQCGLDPTPDKLSCQSYPHCLQPTVPFELIEGEYHLLANGTRL